VPEVFDVAVVGAGTMGSQAAYHLARLGLSVLLIDSWDPPHDHGSHHGDTRLYRQAYGGGGSYIPLAIEALAGWLTLEREAGRPIFHPWGVLNLNPADSPLHTEKLANARTWGLRVEEVTLGEVFRRWPGFRPPPGFAGLFERDGGVLESAAAVFAALAGARAAGAVLRTGARVTGWSGTGPVTLETTQGHWAANRVLLTSGSSTSAFLPESGLPIRVVRKVVGWFGTSGYSAPEFPGFTLNTGEAQFYGFPSIQGSGVKVGRHDGGQAFDPETNPEPFGHFAEDEADLRSFLQDYLPGAAGRLLKSAVCRYDLTPDKDFCIGQVPGLPVWYATGFSGHGFKFAPALGFHLAQWVAGLEKSELLEPFENGGRRQA
jgi:N-methyl-L-tryptophan oxidase